jgi:hypothetical protein
MARQLTNRSRHLAGALAVMLAIVSSATCLAAASQMPDAGRHACCAAMGDDCGSAATVDEDCCAGEQSGLTTLAPAASFELVAPIATSEVLLSSPPVVRQFTSAAFDPDASQPVSPPTYLLDSVFRI